MIFYLVRLLPIAILIALEDGRFPITAYGKAYYGLQSSSQLWWGAGPLLSPAFLDTATNVTANVGDTALLPCSVQYLGDRSVTWMRQRDLHILTAGVFTYSADERFKVLHPESSNNWTLQIQFVTERDTGLYECQVNSDPKISKKVFLAVKEHVNQLDDPGILAETPSQMHDYVFEDPTEFQKKMEEERQRRMEKKGRKRRRGQVPSVEIRGPKELFIQRGSVLSLTCIVHHAPRRPPRQLLWFRGIENLDYDSPRGGVSVQTEKLVSRTISKLSIAAISPTDSGDYSCSPTDMPSYVVTVHVQDGQHQAAVYQGGLSSATTTSSMLLDVLFAFCFLLFNVLHKLLKG